MGGRKDGLRQPGAERTSSSMTYSTHNAQLTYSRNGMGGRKDGLRQSGAERTSSSVAASMLLAGHHSLYAPPNIFANLASFMIRRTSLSLVPLNPPTHPSQQWGY